MCIHTTVLRVYCTRGVHYTVPLFAFSFTVYAYSISTTYHARCTVGRETNRRFEFQLARGFRRFTPCSRVYSCEKVHTAYREHTGSVLSADCAVWRTGVRPPRAPHTYAAFRPSCHRSPSRGCEGRGPRARDRDGHPIKGLRDLRRSLGISQRPYNLSIGITSLKLANKNVQT